MSGHIDLDISDIVLSVDVQAPWKTKKLTNKTIKPRQVRSYNHEMTRLSAGKVAEVDPIELDCTCCLPMRTFSISLTRKYLPPQLHIHTMHLGCPKSGTHFLKS